jgi:bacteriocin-like protein
MILTDKQQGNEMTNETRELNINELEAVSGGNIWMEALRYVVVDKIIDTVLPGLGSEGFVGQAAKAVRG